MRALAAAGRAALGAALARQGLEVAGWRMVPVGAEACGAEALKTLPHIEQLFVNCPSVELDEAAFNRGCSWRGGFAEKALERGGSRPSTCPSLSASTIVFKGMVMPQYLAQFYPDLADPRLDALGGGVPPALLDQHAAAVAARAPVSLSGAQRRDQHGAGQPQLGHGARPAVPLAAAAGLSRRSSRSYR